MAGHGAPRTHRANVRRGPFGLSWQITPRTLIDAMVAGGDEAKRAFEAMMQMKKIDVATIDAARRGTR
jgi:predicted 3-demethylubiquinone-9 3-methyltransferase (glyoxalase superfamily)